MALESEISDFKYFKFEISDGNAKTAAHRTWLDLSWWLHRRAQQAAPLRPKGGMRDK
jgi:hypothetical protein